jgi:hypothetical protein
MDQRETSNRNREQQPTWRAAQGLHDIAVRWGHAEAVVIQTPLYEFCCQDQTRHGSKQHLRAPFLVSFAKAVGVGHRIVHRVIAQTQEPRHLGHVFHQLLPRAQVLETSAREKQCCQRSRRNNRA